MLAILEGWETGPSGGSPIAGGIRVGEFSTLDAWRSDSHMIAEVERLMREKLQLVLRCFTDYSCCWQSVVGSLDVLVWNFSKAGLEGPTLQSYTREAPGDAETLPPIREGLAEAWRVQGQSRNHLDQQILEAQAAWKATWITECMRLLLVWDGLGAYSSVSSMLSGLTNWNLLCNAGFTGECQTQRWQKWCLLQSGAGTVKGHSDHLWLFIPNWPANQPTGSNRWLFSHPTQKEIAVEILNPHQLVDIVAAFQFWNWLHFSQIHSIFWSYFPLGEILPILLRNFYRAWKPSEVFNRDLSVLVLSVFGQLRCLALLFILTCFDVCIWIVYDVYIHNTS